MSLINRINKFYIKIINLIEEFLMLLKVLYFSTKSIFKNQNFKDNFIYLTAADEEFYEPVKNLINSIKEVDSENRIILYDLGLKVEQITSLKQIKGIEIIKFDFDNYPEFVSKKNLPDNKLGNYAWKAAIIHEVFNVFDDNVIWIDSGCLVGMSLNKIKKIIESNGSIFFKSSGKIKDWTHIDTVKIMNGDNFLNENCVMATIFGFKNKSKVNDIFINEWKKYSLMENCISPIGSSRLNHRQDQSIFQILVYKLGLKKNIFLHKNFGLKTNQIFNKIYIQESIKDTNTKKIKDNIYKISPPLFSNSMFRAKLIILFNNTNYLNNKLDLINEKKILIISDNSNHLQIKLLYKNKEIIKEKISYEKLDYEKLIYYRDFLPI